MAKKKRYIGELKLGQGSIFTQLDEYYWNITSFTGLKLFGHYSKIVQ